ncbi:hypothetical protein GL279_18935 [Paracoccus limosus]|uniref:Uncharacterized protein n=1 Tax=Paracoccus limosus TaxID=913252 RepID=A0A844H6K1_9RHOB|nr:hypothetical protein [Paracoccus limosus]MTH36649.1 hypothetical protein [Paracoccus limosus]
MTPDIAAEAEKAIQRIYALSRAEQDRLIAEMQASADPSRAALGKELRDALTVRRLMGMG